MEESIKQPQLSIELKQTSEGFWYAGSLKVNAENLEEFDKLLLNALKKSTAHLMNLNNMENSVGCMPFSTEFSNG